MAKKDELGNKYGTMIVIREVPKEEKISKDRSIYWELQCELCGAKRIIDGHHLRQRGIKCNCQKIYYEDLTGQTFGRLTVVRMATKEERGTYNQGMAWCQCSCGNPELILVRSSQLKRGQKSCGCLKSKGEEFISQILRDNNINFKKEYSFSNLRGDRLPLRFDFAIFNNDNLIGLIECDGLFHRHNSWNNYLEKQQQYDQLKDDYCREHNIPLLRIEYNTEADIKEEEILTFIRSNI